MYISNVCTVCTRSLPISLAVFDIGLITGVLRYNYKDYAWVLRFCLEIIEIFPAQFI